MVLLKKGDKKRTITRPQTRALGVEGQWKNEKSMNEKKGELNDERK